MIQHRRVNQYKQEPPWHFRHGGKPLCKTKVRSAMMTSIPDMVTCGRCKEGLELLSPGMDSAPRKSR